MLRRWKDRQNLQERKSAQAQVWATSPVRGVRDPSFSPVMDASTSLLSLPLGNQQQENCSQHGRGSMEHRPPPVHVCLSR